jgi:hypothetical protein
MDDFCFHRSNVYGICKAVRVFHPVDNFRFVFARECRRVAASREANVGGPFCCVRFLRFFCDRFLPRVRFCFYSNLRLRLMSRLLLLLLAWVP